MHHDDNTGAESKTIATLRAVGAIEIRRLLELIDELKQLQANDVIDARQSFEIASIHCNAGKAVIRFLVDRRGKRS